MWIKVGHNLFAPILPRREFELDEVFAAYFKFWRNSSFEQSFTSAATIFYLASQKKMEPPFWTWKALAQKKLFAFLSRAFCPKDIFPSHHHSQFSIQCFFWVCSHLLDSNERSARNVTQNYLNYLLKYAKDKRTLETHKGFSIRFKSGKKKRTVHLLARLTITRFRRVLWIQTIKHRYHGMAGNLLLALISSCY